MNSNVENKIEAFFNGIPEYENGVHKPNDIHRLYDIAIAIQENDESIVDVTKYISDKFPENHPHRKDIINECISMLKIIDHFLYYYKSKKITNL